MTGPDDRPDDASTDPPADQPADPRGERDEDALWHEIVANFGDRVQLDLDQADDPEAGHDPDRSTDLAAGRTYVAGPAWPDEPAAEPEPSEDRFVPPAPPPLPRVERRRLWAWLGLFGAPAILLIFLIFTIPMPTLLAWGLVAWFIGGFGWLVWLMPPGPRDPGDDGARV